MPASDIATIKVAATKTIQLLKCCCRRQPNLSIISLTNLSALSRDFVTSVL
ncbi:MAG: hypothetical protein HY097_00785 [Nitrospinae bacterium]|nr:hypothetical protein [Nitrospinota bacterium]MBI3814971.1 hypothetical protein [Nitrospinota bacterium]